MAVPCSRCAPPFIRRSYLYLTYRIATNKPFRICPGFSSPPFFRATKIFLSFAISLKNEFLYDKKLDSSLILRPTGLFLKFLNTVIDFRAVTIVCQVRFCGLPQYLIQKKTCDLRRNFLLSKCVLIWQISLIELLPQFLDLPRYL